MFAVLMITDKKLIFFMLLQKHAILIAPNFTSHCGVGSVNVYAIFHTVRASSTEGYMPFSICDHPLGNIIEFHEKILNPNDSDLSEHEHWLVQVSRVANQTRTSRKIVAVKPSSFGFWFCFMESPEETESTSTVHPACQRWSPSSDSNR